MSTTTTKPVNLHDVDLSDVDTDLAGRLTLGQVVKICRWYALAKTSERAYFDRVADLERRLANLSQAHEVALAELPELLEYLTKLRAKYDETIVALDVAITVADPDENDVAKAFRMRTNTLERRAIVSAQSTAEALALRIEAMIKRRDAPLVGEDPA